MSSRRVRAMKRALGLAIGSVLAGISVSNVRAEQPYGLYFDLRLSAGGGKTAQVTAPGDVVAMDLYAYLTGVNDDPSDNKLQSSMGSFLSSNGGLLGDLLGLPPRSPFNAAGSTIGEQHDIDGDGDLDVSQLSGATTFGYYAVRAGQLTSSPSGSFFLGQVSFTVTEAANASTEVNYVPRPYWSDGSSSAAGALAWVDGNLIDGHSLDLHVGPPVKISCIGPVVDPGQTQYLSGTIGGHISVNGAVRPEAGTTLFLTKGLDIASGGDFDTRDAQGGYGDHEVRVDDSTSGNAGGTLNTGRMYVGHSGTGVFTQSAGLTRISADLGDSPNVVVGKSPDSSGTLDCIGGTLIARKVIVGGSRSTGLLRVTGGNATLTDLDIGMANCTSAILEVDGTGNLTVTNEAHIGSTGTGLFRQKGGSSSFGSLKIGFAPNANGILELSGGNIAARMANVGFDGLGSVRQTGGRASLGGLLVAARVPGGVCTYTLDGGDMDIGGMDVGHFGSGLFQQNAGTLTSSGTIAIGAIGASTGRIELRGGQFLTKREIIGRKAGRGAVLQNGGQHTVDWMEIRKDSAFTYSGGTLRVSDHLQLAGTFDFANSAVTLTLGNNSFADFSQGTILNSSAAGIVAGKFSLMNFPAGFDPYAKFASIETEGLIHIAGQPLVIPATEAIYGSGTIEGDVINQGLVSPGNSPGTLTVAGKYEQGKLASLHIELAGTDAESKDLLQITGRAVLDGLLDVELLGEFKPAFDDCFTILAADSIQGLFANAADNITFDKGSFEVLYTSNSVVLTHFVAVPEPSMAGLLLLPLLLIRRSRRERH